MKKVLIGIVILLVLAGAGAVGLKYYAENKATTAVDDYLNSLPDVGAVSHGGVQYSFLDNKLVVPDINLNFKRDDFNKVQIAKMEAEKPDLGTAQNIYGGKDSTDTTFNDLAGRITAEGVSISDDEKTITMGLYSVEGLKVRPLPFDQNTPTSELYKPENIGTVVSSFQADQILLNNIQLGEKDQKDLLTIKATSVVNLKGAAMGSFSMTDLSVNNQKEKGRVRIQSITGKNIDFSNALDALALLSQGAPVPPDAAARVKYDNISVKGIEVDTPESGTVKVSEVTVSDFKQQGMVPTSLNFDIKGVQVAVDKLKNPQAQMTLTQMGYDTLDVNFNLKYNWEEQSKQLTIDNLGVGFENGGKVALKLDVTGVDLANLKDPMQAMGAFSGASLKGAEISYIDASLLKRLLRWPPRPRVCLPMI